MCHYGIFHIRSIHPTVLVAYIDENGYQSCIHVQFQIPSLAFTRFLPVKPPLYASIRLCSVHGGSHFSENFSSYPDDVIKLNEGVC